MQAQNCLELGVRGDESSLGIFFHPRGLSKFCLSGKSSIWEMEIGYVLCCFQPPFALTYPGTPLYYFSQSGDKHKLHVRKEGLILANTSRGCSPSWQGRAGENRPPYICSQETEMKSGGQLVQSSSPQHGASYSWSDSSHLTNLI